MPWQYNLTTMLRLVIYDAPDDVDDRVYTDARLEELIVVAANLVIQEMAFSNTYTVDIAATSISPDPITQKDTVFQNMVVLKAACLADQSTLRTRAQQAGITAKVGPASISTSNSLNGYALLLEQGPCATYERLKWEYEMGDAQAQQAIRAVLSPFVGPNYDPRGGSSQRSN